MSCRYLLVVCDKDAVSKEILKLKEFYVSIGHEIINSKEYGDCAFGYKLDDGSIIMVHWLEGAIYEEPIYVPV